MAIRLNGYVFNNEMVGLTDHLDKSDDFISYFIKIDNMFADRVLIIRRHWFGFPAD